MTEPGSTPGYTTVKTRIVHEYDEPSQIPIREATPKDPTAIAAVRRRNHRHDRERLFLLHREEQDPFRRLPDPDACPLGRAVVAVGRGDR